MHSRLQSKAQPKLFKQFTFFEYMIFSHKSVKIVLKHFVDSMVNSHVVQQFVICYETLSNHAT